MPMLTWEGSRQCIYGRALRLLTQMSYTTDFVDAALKFGKVAEFQTIAERVQRLHTISSIQHLAATFVGLVRDLPAHKKQALGHALEHAIVVAVIRQKNTVYDGAQPKRKSLICNATSGTLQVNHVKDCVAVCQTCDTAKSVHVSIAEAQALKLHSRVIVDSPTREPQALSELVKLAQSIWQPHDHLSIDHALVAVAHAAASTVQSLQQKWARTASHELAQLWLNL